MTRIAKPRRSVLYVPTTNQKALLKAGTLACDAVIYDLEDAVAPSAKSEAREALRTHFAQRGSTSAEQVIRINAAQTQWWADDLSAAIEAQPDAILLPKVERTEEILNVADALRAAGLESVRLWAMIETPLGIVNIKDIAALGEEANSRLDCFVVGTNDLAKEAGIPIPEGRSQLSAWLMQIVLHARAFGIDVVDGVYNDFRDEAGFEAECAAGVLMGFDGKTLIHPNQIAPANENFSPNPEALAEAEKIVSAFQQPENANKGVISIDGKMVERLHLEIARKTIAKAGR